VREKEISYELKCILLLEEGISKYLLGFSKGKRYEHMILRKDCI
jgi:hypothetical protein